MACKAANRCIVCGKAEGCNSKCNQNTKSCILCGGDTHNSLESSKCSVWAKEKKVVEIMTIKKVSKSEAIGMYNLNNNNRFSALDDFEGNFPHLDTKKTVMINNDEVVNKKLTTTKYNQVVKKNIPQVSAPPKPTYNAPRVKASIQPVYEMANWSKKNQNRRLRWCRNRIQKRHQAWGDRICNSKGSIIINEISYTNLQCINTGTITHRTGNSAGSVIDITFTNINSSLIKWQCHQVHLGGSKHFPITIEITNTGKKPNFFIPKKQLARELAQVSFDDLENFTNVIDNVKNKIKIDLNKANRTPKEWWSEELNKHYRLHVAKRKKANHTNRIEDMEESIKATGDWKDAVKKAKKSSYNNKIEEINANPNSKNAWNFIRNVKGNKRPLHNWAAEDDRNYLEIIKEQAEQASNHNITCCPSFHASPSASNGSIDFSYMKFEKLLAKKKSTAGGLDRQQSPKCLEINKSNTNPQSK
ncbi:uncharacterized protein LOC118754971 [Rhagoletis pomonella]|uniref:uncharacterized protein LOC118754971 n=1 Tax=Rhagoletis pomonella TaxID=28610 RepID=UPI00177D171E|nr:uncharacterized protein LOC118754971 [Rhagoletis pomonella]